MTAEHGSGGVARSPQAPALAMPRPRPVRRLPTPRASLLAAVVAALLIAQAPRPAAAQKLEPSLRDAVEAVQGGRYGEALEGAERALAANPSGILARFVKAVALAGEGRVEEAEAIYRALIAEYPELPEPHNNLAVLLAQRGDLDGARRELELAVAIAPGYTLAAENLGDVHVRLAILAYRRAAQRPPVASGVQAKLRRAEEIGKQLRSEIAPGAREP